MTVRDIPIERKRSLCVVSCWLLVADCKRIVIFFTGVGHQLQPNLGTRFDVY